MKNRDLLRVIISLAGLAIYSCTQKLPSPDGLMVDLLRAPDQAVVTDSVPDFSWIVPGKVINQQAYQILVASEENLLDNEKADLWNSGKIESNQSSNVSYDGRPLKPSSSYWWKVKVWGENSESKFSDPQKFNTGVFVRNDEWIGQSNWIELEDSLWVSEDRQIAKFQDVEPNNIVKHNNHQYFIDFGKAAFATFKLTVETELDSQRLEVYLGERKNEDNTVDKNTGISNIAIHEEQLFLKKGKHTYQLDIPRHVGRYMHSQKLAPFYPEVVPYRYVEIVSEENFDLLDIQQQALFYYFDDEASAFNSSSQNLNRVWDLCKYTLKATPFLGVYADGNRERMPYEADAYIQQLGHYSVDREFSAARYTILFLLSHASWPTEWQMHTVKMAYEHFLYTGDLELISDIYEDLKPKTLIDLAREDGLISTRTGKITPEFLASINYGGESIRDIVDWPRGTPEGEEQIPMAGPTPEGERDGYVFTDYNTVVNAFHYNALMCMAEMAQALGKQEDHQFYIERAELAKNSIVAHFFDKERGIFVDGIETDHASLHANMFPVAFNIVPEGYAASITDHIKSRGMACSVYGAQYLLEALYNLGEDEYALNLMTSEDKRSWINMLEMGSTMTTEAWDEYYKPNLTWNHAWGSAPANIIPRRMLGIRPLNPGFNQFEIKPQLNGLQDVEIKVPTIKGTILCKINNDQEEWRMQVSIPGNTEASIFLPEYLDQPDVKAENDYSEIALTQSEINKNNIRLKSGDYLISAEKLRKNNSERNKLNLNKSSILGRNN